jgi:hypothetical protein
MAERLVTYHTRGEFQLSRGEFAEIWRANEHGLDLVTSVQQSGPCWESTPLGRKAASAKGRLRIDARHVGIRRDPRVLATEGRRDCPERQDEHVTPTPCCASSYRATPRPPEPAALRVWDKRVRGGTTVRLGWLGPIASLPSVAWVAAEARNDRSAPLEHGEAARCPTSTDWSESRG